MPWPKIGAFISDLPATWAPPFSRLSGRRSSMRSARLGSTSQSSVKGARPVTKDGLLQQPLSTFVSSFHEAAHLAWRLMERLSLREVRQEADLVDRVPGSNLYRHGAHIECHKSVVFQFVGGNDLARLRLSMPLPASHVLLPQRRAHALPNSRPADRRAGIQRQRGKNPLRYSTGLLIGVQKDPR